MELSHIQRLGSFEIILFSFVNFHRKQSKKWKTLAITNMIPNNPTVLRKKKIRAYDMIIELINVDK